MNQEVAVVKKNPLGRLVTFYADRKLPRFLKKLPDLIGNCLPLPLVRRRADYKIVGKGCNLTQIENDKVFSFFGFGCPGRNQPIWLFGSVNPRGFRDGGREFSARVADLLGLSVLHWNCMRKSSRMLRVSLIRSLAFSTISTLCFAASSPNSSSSSASYARVASSATTRAISDVERVRMLVEQGVLPPKSLEDAESKLADAQDEEILANTLYGGRRVQDLSPADADVMVQAAQRRLDRQNKTLADRLKLVEGGVLAQSEVKPVQDELEMRRHTLELAQNRGKLLNELLAMARAEQALEQARASELAALQPVMIRYPGTAPFTIAHDLKTIGDAFSNQFHEPLPVSALGQTLIHQGLGFDHRGRVDVGLNPDATEGLWLRSYLERRHIPYIAFRAAVTGSATAPHIHIGPGSMRLKLAPPPDVTADAASARLPRPIAAPGS